ncbi:cupin domain-containing protein [Nocardioides sp. CBS4Y-1]|uniref:Cupin domain-containing protein n=2 Tax=Nocardioides acrostichi TaxID=2784339 RepID=A0A930Y4Y3_9ACTN|nr:cupin domain-containing protein [Nocardioides acrostichi]
MRPHPEGGWYRETWRAPVPADLDDGRRRACATAILFLLPAGESSAWHRVASDELWMAHVGTVLLELAGAGDAPSGPGGEPVEQVRLGVDTARGQQPQALVPAGVWQRTVPVAHDALVSCVVAPGFDFEDFELAAP